MMADEQTKSNWPPLKFYNVLNAPPCLPGCISTSYQTDTWLALDWVRKNTTVPAGCNSNVSWVGHCYYTHAPTGIAVARNARALLVAHGAENPPVIRAFDKTGGRLIGSL